KETEPIEEEQIETASNIIVDIEDAIGENKTRQISYSEVVGQYQRERRREDYDKMIELLKDPELLITLIKHKITTILKNYPIPVAIKAKLQYKNKAFFRSFTRYVLSQPQYQK
ncbi:1566_t:CDS:2, partial [Gigaspora margarita]